jgi:hypothetical protein
MAKTIVALYEDFDTARRAVEALTDGGFPREGVSLIASEKGAATVTEYLHRSGDVALDDEDNVTAGEGAGFGAVVGALVGLGVALIPGIGPVLAAGPLAAALMAGIGAAAGAATGGIVAGLADFGVPEGEAEMYAEGIRRGAALVSVTADTAHLPMVEDTLNRFNPVDLDERATGWRAAGWGESDTESSPYVGVDATTPPAPLAGPAAGEIAARTGTTAGMPETEGYEDDAYRPRARTYSRE